MWNRTAGPSVLIGLAFAVLLFGCGGGNHESDNGQPGIVPQRAAASLLNSPPTPDPGSLMDWAESAYSQFFPSHQPTLLLDPFVYRHYPETENYLGVAGDQVYIKGPVANGGLLNVGTLQNFGCFVYPRYCSALSNAYLPRLRGSQVIANLNWKDPGSVQWQNLSGMLGSGANAVRLMLDPYDASTGDLLLPGQPLSVRIDAAIGNYGNLIEYLLARDVHVVLVLNTYFTYPAMHTWPDDGRTLWSSASAQQEVVDTWVALANRYKGRPGLVFDVLNEPHGVTDAEANDSHKIAREQWNLLHARVTSAVHEVDSTRWVVVEPIWGDAESLHFLQLAPAGSRVGYSIHYYNPHYFTHQGVGSWPAAGTVPYPGVTRDKSWLPSRLWTKEVLESELKIAKDFATANNVRMFLGEAGVERSAPDDSRQRWAADVSEIAERFGFDVLWFGWDGWNYSGIEGGWSWQGSALGAVLSSLFSLNFDPAKR